MHESPLLLSHNRVAYFWCIQFDKATTWQMSEHVYNPGHIHRLNLCQCRFNPFHPVSGKMMFRKLCHQSNVTGKPPLLTVSLLLRAITNQEMKKKVDDFLPPFSFSSLAMRRWGPQTFVFVPPNISAGRRRRPRNIYRPLFLTPHGVTHWVVL